MVKIDWNRRYYYDDLMEYARTLSKKYSDMLQYNVIGSSRDKRDIFLLKAGHGEKNIILTGGIHGRETINPLVLIAMMEYYCFNPKPFMEQYTIYCIPLLNPDGYMIALRGFDVIQEEHLRIKCKAKKIPYYLWKYNANVIDINRNFPSITWKSKFHRDTPASEPETKVLIELFHTIPSVGYIDYHSRGRTIYYYRNSMSEEYNKHQYRIACTLCKITDYMLVPKQEEITNGDSGGNTVHYYSESCNQPAFTIETVDDCEVFPLDTKWQEISFREICDSPFSLCDRERH